MLVNVALGIKERLAAELKARADAKQRAMLFAATFIFTQ
jgi:hypothetical protein